MDKFPNHQQASLFAMQAKAHGIHLDMLGDLLDIQCRHTEASSCCVRLALAILAIVPFRSIRFEQLYARISVALMPTQCFFRSYVLKLVRFMLGA